VINLRFHIVSITAVFLALAIGIFMGSTLLDRSTVDLLETRQKSLDAKITERVKENNALRQALDKADASGKAAHDTLQRPFTAGTVTDSVVVVAGRGLDEDSVQRSIDDVVAAGGTYGGTIWVDSTTLLTDAAVRSSVAQALGLPESTSQADLVKATQKAVAAALSATTATPAAPVDTVPGEVTSTTLPTRSPGQVLAALQAAGVVGWDLPDGASTIGSAATAPRVVLVSGEGVDPKVEAYIAELATPLVAASPGRVTAAELLVERSSTGLIERNIAGQPPVRGRFVDRLRKAADPVAVATIDDLDRPQGRMSLVLVLAAKPGTATQAFGETDTATTPFPPAPSGS